MYVYIATKLRCASCAVLPTRPSGRISSICALASYAFTQCAALHVFGSVSQFVSPLLGQGNRRELGKLGRHLGASPAARIAFAPSSTLHMSVTLSPPHRLCPALRTASWHSATGSSHSAGFHVHVCQPLLVTLSPFPCSRPMLCTALPVHRRAASTTHPHTPTNATTTRPPTPGKNLPGSCPTASLTRHHSPPTPQGPPEDLEEAWGQSMTLGERRRGQQRRQSMRMPAGLRRRRQRRAPRGCCMRRQDPTPPPPPCCMPLRPSPGALWVTSTAALRRLRRLRRLRLQRRGRGWGVPGVGLPLVCCTAPAPAPRLLPLGPGDSMVLTCFSQLDLTAHSGSDYFSGP